MSKMSAREFAEKMEWEGGIPAGFEYGLRPDDLADDVDPEFVEAVTEAYSFFLKTVVPYDVLRAYLDDEMLEWDDEE